MLAYATMKVAGSIVSDSCCFSKKYLLDNGSAHIQKYRSNSEVPIVCHVV